MKTPKAHLYIRVALPNGAWRYAKPAYSANRKLRSLYAVVDGKVEHHPEGVYYLRYARDGKRIWERISEDPNLALVRLHQRNHAFEAEALGLPVPATIAPVPESEPKAPKTSLQERG